MPVTYVVVSLLLALVVVVAYWVVALVRAAAWLDGADVWGTVELVAREAVHGALGAVVVTVVLVWSGML